MPIRYSPNVSSDRSTTPTANPLTVTIARGTPASGGVFTDTFTLTATFSRQVSTFTGGVLETFSDDASQASHTFTSSDSITYTITVTLPTATQGTVRYKIPANSAVANDDSTPGPPSEVFIDVNFDTRIPVVRRFDRPFAAIATADNENTTVLWNVGIQSFVDADLTVVWSDTMNEGTVTVDHTDGDNSSILEIGYPNNHVGQVSITINDNSVERNVAPNRTGPVGAEVLRISYNTTGMQTDDDTTPPTMEIRGALQDPWRNRALRLQFIASEAITGFTQGDIQVSNAATTIRTFTEVSNTQWDVDFLFPASLNEAVTFTVPVDSFTDIAGNENVVAATKTVNVDTRPVTNNFPNGTQICAETYTIANNPYIQDAMGVAQGGYFIGVLETEYHNNNLYMLVQVMRKADGNDEPAYQQQAAGALVRVDLSTNTCSVLERYDHITLAPRSMVVHQNELHLFWCSHYIYIDPPDEDAWLGHVGYIRKITSSNNIVYVARPYRYRARLTNTEDINIGWGGGTTSPMLSHDDELHLISGYGNLYELTDNTSDAARYANWQWQVLRQRINRRVPKFETNERIGFDVLKELAFISDAIIGFDNNGFFMKPRGTVEAELDMTVDTSTTSTIAYRNRNRDFPSSGMFVIDNEVFSYTGRNSVSLTGVQRAQAHTVATAHMEGSSIYFIHNTINMKDSSLYKPIDSMKVDLFDRHFYNVVRLTYGREDPNFDPVVSEARNEQSIADNKNKETVLERDLPLSRHQGVWGDFIAEKLLDRFGVLRYMITLELKMTTFLKPGDYFWLSQKQKAHIEKVLQVVSVSHDTNNQSTTIEAITIN